MKSLLKDKKIVSWAFYDWANSAYATVVMAGFFPLFFKHYWSTGAEVTTSSFRLGIANSAASIVIVLLAPILGAIADAGGSKKRFLIFFACLGIFASGGLFFAGQGQWLLAVLLFIMGTIGFSGSVVFYDALIVLVAPRGKLDFVSAFGFAMGYLGGGILFALNVFMYLNPEVFGFASPSAAIRASFIGVAIWWAIFTIPLIIFVREPGKVEHVSAAQAVKNGFKQLAHTFQEIRKLRVVFLFLLAYWFYIDGVDTIVRMAVDYGMSLGFDAGNLITALLITQFVGFPSAIAFGFIGQRFGARFGIYLAISVYTIVTIWAVWMDKVEEFYILAVVIGLVQGGVQSLSRSFYARIIPAEKSAEFFGFYNMLGKFAAVLGPLMMGLVGILTESTRLSILSVVILFLIGGTLLYFVDEKEGQRIAETMR